MSASPVSILSNMDILAPDELAPKLVTCVSWAVLAEAAKPARENNEENFMVSVAPVESAGCVRHRCLLSRASGCYIIVGRRSCPS